MSKHLTSLTRIADLERITWSTLPREQWAWGDYVLTEVVRPPGRARTVEYRDGRMGELDIGDLVVGAFGTREATLEATGGWEDIDPDEPFELLTPAGLLGKLRSLSPMISQPVSLRYRGHALRDGQKVTMGGSMPPAGKGRFELPVVLIVGSSMSAGKTASARTIIRRLTAMGQRVIGAKLTGAARMRDVLSMRDAGATAIFDFVDCGLPSTVCSPDLFRQRMSGLLARMAEVPADIAVIEAGASPLEPYNGEAVMQLLDDHVRMMVLSASDPYAVVGISQAFERQPDLITGIATNTDASIALIEKLTGLTAMRLVRRREVPELDELLIRSFELSPPS